MTMADPRLLLRIALLAAVYTIVGRLGLLMDPVAGFATLVWPPSGIALAALVLYGRALWPGVALGAFFVNIWVGAPMPVALGIAAGNTLEARARRVGAFAHLRLQPLARAAKRRDRARRGARVPHDCRRGHHRHDEPRARRHHRRESVSRRVASLVGRRHDRRFAGRPTASHVGCAPQAQRRPRVEARPSRSRRCCSRLASSCSALGVPARFEWLRRANFLLPILMWAAIRFGPRGATATAFACAVLALWGTVSGYGPFVRLGSLRDAIVGLQVYLPLIAASFLALGAVTAERSELLRREHAARLEAERAVEARDEFLAVAAHELATPLTPLQLELETLQRSLSGPEVAANVQRRLDRAFRQTKRLARLTERLLDVSRLAGGHLSLDPSDFDFSEMVKEVVEEFRGDAVRAGSELTLAASEPIVGRWDRVRAAQIVANLLSNAVKYGAGKAIALDVQASSEEVVLTVEDHGDGIEPGALARIFQRFERASPERRRGGLGLGLYVARELVEAHGGTLRVASTPGSGSTFTVSLPRRPAAASAASMEGAEPEAEPAPAGALRGIDSG